MSLKPWREISLPHKDVLEGTFKQSEFAADISQVVSGTATPEYQDAQLFFKRTYITEGMRLLLVSVAQRLSGNGGDPVIQLQTPFGGGKTHTMLAVLHLANHKIATNKLEGIPSILNEAGIKELPKANIAVIDGIKLSPSQPQKYGSITANTLWGELAYQLLGEKGYAMVAESDATGTSPGKEIMRQLIAKASPCVILMDELVAFLRQLEFGKQYKAGTFDSNISFIQALTEALKSVPNAILLASLPESELEVGGIMGQRALDSLQQYFGRVESVWKPVASTESFEIVRRRLFENPGNKSEVENICQQFSEFYKTNSSKFPVETQSNFYHERLCQSYPIHPEIFDRLYEDWSTLDKFQRTRGVLQYMAIIIHRLWNSENRDALIMPGSIALDDNMVRNKSIHYLPQGWEPVIEKEVDGPRSESSDIDSEARFGAVQAARRSMRTIFLGSAASANSQVIKGIQIERILLGCVQPNQNIGIFEDVLKRLRDRLHYLYYDHDRYWLDTKPNLRREMESRKQHIDDLTQLQPLLKDRLQKLFTRTECFCGIHVFTLSSDIPDDDADGIRLVVLPPEASYNRADARLAYKVSEEILRNRGGQPRQKQNRLIFLAADYTLVNRLKSDAKTYLAWKEIISDIEEEKLNLDLLQVKSARKSCENADKELQHLIRETYKWLLNPVSSMKGNQSEIGWEAISISPAAQNTMSEIANKLHDEEWLFFEWSPIHLQDVLNRWYFKDGAKHINAMKVWMDSCSYLYLPRIINKNIYRNVIENGVESTNYFAFASNLENNNYIDFVFDKKSRIDLEESSLLIEHDEALRYSNLMKSQINSEISNMSGGSTSPSGVSVDSKKVALNTETSSSTAQVAVKTHFYGNINLDPVKAMIQFTDIVNEVVQQFTSTLGAKVSISVDIDVTNASGFDEVLQRNIKENCTTLKFLNSEFEEE